MNGQYLALVFGGQSGQLIGLIKSIFALLLWVSIINQ